MRAVRLSAAGPVFNAVGLGVEQLKFADVQGGKLTHRLVDQHFELLAGVIDVLTGFNLQSQGLVKPGLGFIDIGAGACATGKGFAGGVKLRGGGGALGQHQGQLVITEHGLKVGAANPCREILFVLQQDGFSVLNLGFGLPQLRCEVAAIQRLANGQRLVAAGVFGISGLLYTRKIRCDASKPVVGALQAKRDARQQL